MAGLQDQLRASFALAKASLTATLRSPTSVVFSLLFPVIFIVVFGSMVDNTVVQLKIALAPGCDTANVIYKTITSIKNITIDRSLSSLDATNALQKRRLTAIVDIKKDTVNSQPGHFNIVITSSASSANEAMLLRTLLKNAIASINEHVFPANASVASLSTKELPGRIYRQIDFILPGQLGFSLLASGVFGVAFMFFNLRNTLVLKRFFATPISKTYIVLGEMFSRVIFQMLTAVVIILLGYYAFDFTLVHGLKTFFDMMVLSFIGLVVFMGFGFIVSGLAKNDSTIPPFANLITLPQFLIGGTFFSISVFPVWLQWIARIMPLTHLNTALREVAFEGKGLWDVKTEIGILLLWGIITYAIAVKVFKWE